MAWLRKKPVKNGFVYHIVYSYEGKTRYKSIGQVDEAVAKAILEKFQAELTLERFGVARIKELGFDTESKKKVRLDDYIQEYTQARRHRPLNTRLLDKYALQNFCDYAGNVYLEDITRATVDKYKSYRIQTASPGTVNIELRTMRAAFYYAIELEYLTKNVFSKPKLLKSSEDDLPEFLELDEIEQFRTVIEANNDTLYRRIFEFYLNTGARRAEGLAVHWQDVNFNRRFTFLRHTKTGKARMVPINDTLLSHLQEMYLENNTGRLFTYAPGTPTRKFKKYLRKTIIQKDLHLHNLRDTFASHLIMNGVDMLTVSKYLGHSNIKITEKYYGHLSPGHYRNAINKLPF